jgi:hypothetical protein
VLRCTPKGEMASPRLMGNHWSHWASVKRGFSTFDLTCPLAMGAGMLGRLSGDLSSTHSVGYSLFTPVGAKLSFNGAD